MSAPGNEDRSRFDDIECPDYCQSTAGTRRCRSYVEGGRCDLPGYVMCVEWLRRNPDGRPPGTGPAVTSELPAASVELAPAPVLSGAPALRDAVLSTPAAHPVDKPAGYAVGLDLVTEKSLADLAATGAEVDLLLKDGKALTLVPAYTGTGRRELSFRDCATIVACIKAFPGATFTGFKGGSER